MRSSSDLRKSSREQRVFQGWFRAVLQSFAKGKYRVWMAADTGDVDRAQQLRYRSFHTRRGSFAPDSCDQQGRASGGRDSDAFDAACQHVLIEDIASATLVCCYRLLLIPAEGSLRSSYSAQFYDLAAVQRLPGAKLELGRFCLHPDWHDPDILRLAWAAMTRVVDRAAVQLLFGCSSFDGANPDLHRAALVHLAAQHLAPARWQPGRRAAQIYAYADALRGVQPHPTAALRAMPPLLRSYLAMGAWVSDHAVIDADLDTLHVLTCVEIAAIPPARAKLLHALAQ